MHWPGKLLDRSDRPRSRLERWARKRLTWDLFADVLIYLAIICLLGIAFMVPTVGIFVLGIATGIAAMTLIWR